MKALLTIALLLTLNSTFGQYNENKKQNVFRLNYINPGLEYEYAFGDKSKLATNLGYGIALSYPELTAIHPGHAFFVAPFFELHYKNIYNINKRELANKNVKCNSGNFWGIRCIARGPNQNTALVRTADIDFAVGPTWGIQRSNNKKHTLFSLGPVYYFDGKQDAGIYLLMLELNIGLNLHVKRRNEQPKASSKWKDSVG